MDDNSLTCEACGGKVLASPEEMEQHKKDAHGGGEGGGAEGGTEGGGEAGGGDAGTAEGGGDPPVGGEGGESQ